MPKLKAPMMRYITRGEQELCPMATEGFFAKSSFATGVLANAWGAQVYRFSERELDPFPFLYELAINESLGLAEGKCRNVESPHHLYQVNVFDYNTVIPSRPQEPSGW